MCDLNKEVRSYINYLKVSNLSFVFVCWNSKDLCFLIFKSVKAACKVGHFQRNGQYKTSPHILPRSRTCKAMVVLHIV